MPVSERTITVRFSSLINDVMCLIALPGIVLMIVSNELTFASFDYRETYMTYLIKLTITLSTIALIGLILYYHYLSLQFFCVNNCIQHWYIALTPNRLIQMIVEISICLIHPFPRKVFSDYRSPSSLNINATSIAASPISLSFIPLDVALGLPSTCEPVLVFYKLITLFLVSVCPFISPMPCHHPSFTIPARFFIAITWKSQSSAYRLLLHCQSVSRAVARILLNSLCSFNILHSLENRNEQNALGKRKKSEATDPRK